MARPVWTGSLGFGLVNVGVGLFTATENRTVSFHQLEKGTNKRVRNKRVTNREVDYEDVVKGYETRRDNYVVLTQEELESVEPETSRTLTIEDFVDLADIDPIYYENAYYLAPRDEEQAHAYALLREAMKKAGLAGIASFVMRNKEYLAAIRAADDVLVLHTMLFADEVREPRDVADLPGDRKLPKRELDSALHLIRELTAPWDPKRYHDTYREQVLQLVEQKAKGQEIHIEPPEEPAENVIDLVSALEESIKRAQKRQGGSADLEDMSKQELYDRAGKLDVSGRSTMSKDELRKAVAKAS